jgi:micrococcal nuclease
LITRTIDGDTVCCDIELMSRFGADIPPSDVECDLGFSFWMKPILDAKIWYRDRRVRLYGINAPETRGATKEAGNKSKAFLRSLVQDREVLLQTIKVKEKDKADDFGRYLGIIYFQGVNVNERLVAEGYAEAKHYR